MTLLDAAPSDASPASAYAVAGAPVIGPEGGVDALGTFSITIAAGALTHDTPITIQQIEAPVEGAVGPVYEVGPTGTLFLTPAAVLLSYGDLELGGVDPNSLRVATFAGGRWTPVPSFVNPVVRVVSAQITHLSPWTLVSTVP
ncbi:MAG TPA: hypothetical protein VHL80_19195 [Polyangia bacterium]|nr:hypothetical protein [Polyangia bacterium]